MQCLVRFTKEGIVRGLGLRFRLHILLTVVRLESKMGADYMTMPFDKLFHTVFTDDGNVRACGRDVCTVYNSPYHLPYLRQGGHNSGPCLHPLTRKRRQPESWNGRPTMTVHILDSSLTTVRRMCTPASQHSVAGSDLQLNNRT